MQRRFNTILLNCCSCLHVIVAARNSNTWKIIPTLAATEFHTILSIPRVSRPHNLYSISSVYCFRHQFDVEEAGFIHEVLNLLFFTTYHGHHFEPRTSPSSSAQSLDSSYFTIQIPKRCVLHKCQMMACRISTKPVSALSSYAKRLGKHIRSIHTSRQRKYSGDFLNPEARKPELPSTP